MKVSLAPDPIGPCSVVGVVVSPMFSVMIWGREEPTIVKCYLSPPQSVIWQVENHCGIAEAVRKYLLGILKN